MISGISKFVAAGFLAATLTAPIHAQSTSWKIDARYSTAKLAADGSVDDVNQNIVLGEARVNGRLHLDKSDPTKSEFTFSIYPAGSGVPVIDENGNPTGKQDVANYTLITFHSQSIVDAGDGTVKVTGPLTVTHVERTVEMDANEGYSGPVYGAAIVHQATRNESLVLAVGSDVLPGQDGTKLQLVGNVNVSREDFPQLLTAIVAADWPIVALDEECAAPSDANEGYQAPVCSGTAISVPSLPFEYTGGGEGYNGPQHDVAFGDHLTITLFAQLTPEPLPASAKLGQ